MLTPAFFAAAYRVLRPAGRLTVLTDNANYGARDWLDDLT
jgi:tRNA G46 methylase TrmB